MTGDLPYHWLEHFVRGEDEMYFESREKCTCPHGLDHHVITND